MRDTTLRDLYQQHAGRVYAYAIRRGASPEMAEDVVSESFLVAWRRLDDIPPGFEFPWLLRVARLTLANQHRGDRRRRSLTTHLTDVPAPVVGRHDDASDAAEFDLVRRAFAQLSAEDRDVLAMVAWDGLSAGEAARVLGCRKATFAVRLHRARQRLSKLMETAAAPPQTLAIATGEDS